MALPVHELVASMVHSQVLRIPDIHKAVVAFPAIRMDHARSQGLLPPNNSLQRGPRAILDNLCVNLSVPLEDPERDSLSEGTSATLPLNSSGPKVGFVNLNLSLKRGCLLAILRDSFSNSHGVAVLRIPIEMGKPRDLDSE